MVITSLDSLGPYDTVYLSPHLDDVALSCTAALAVDRRRGRRTLVATVFTEGDASYSGRRDEDVRALELLGADGIWAGLIDAPFRSSRYRSFSGIVLDRDPGDAQVGSALRTWVEAVLSRSHPRRRVAPLGVGGHIDHLLVHEACNPAGEAELWFYEDRPYALVRGQVESRLESLGAESRPLGLRDHLEAASDLMRAGYVRSHLRPSDALRAPFLRNRRLRPAPAIEPGRWKVEMVIESPDTFAAASQVLACYPSQWHELFHSLRQFERQTRRYCGRISPVPGYVERLWRRS